MSEGWQELNLDKLKESSEDGETFEIELNTSNGAEYEPYEENDDEPDESTEDVSEGESEDLEALDTEEDSEDKSNRRPKKRKSRAQERIKQLVGEKKQLESTLNELQSTVQQLQQNQFNSEAQSISSQLGLVDSNIQALNSKLVQAIEDGDAATQAELITTINRLETDKRILEAKVDRIPKQTESQSAYQTQQQMQNAMAGMPEELQYWIEENPWVTAPADRHDRVKIMKAREIGAQLRNEGYIESEPDFYEELDARLENEFGNSDDDGVEYNHDDNYVDDYSSNTNANRDVKRKAKTKQKPRPVTGRSSSAPPTSRSTKVKLTKAELEHADLLGISPERYAIAKKRKEQAGDGWTNILDNLQQ